MNYFFGYTGNGLHSQLTIPKFQNRATPDPEIQLWGIQSNGDLWEVTAENVEEDEHFFYVPQEQINNQKVFILAKEEELNGFNPEKLTPLNSYTSTLPAYRSNFKLLNQEGGFSSYQSEYPTGMVEKKGGIISSIKSLLNPAATDNYILIRNIYQSPKSDRFNAYLIDYKSKEILSKHSLKTNQTNCIKVAQEHLQPNVFLFTDGYLGIPVYVSQHQGHLSMEHTHPPHSYILSENVFKKVSDLKKEFYEIIHT